MGFCKNKIFSNVFHETDFEREKKFFVYLVQFWRSKTEVHIIAFQGRYEVFYSCFCDKNVEKWCILCTLQMVK